MDSELKIKSSEEQNLPLGYCIDMVGRPAFSDHLERYAAYAT
jgi:hypothetical protein